MTIIKNHLRKNQQPEDQRFSKVFISNLIHEFSRNPVAFRCVNLISGGLSSITFGYNDELTCLFEDNLSFYGFCEKVVFSYLLTGHCFVYVEFLGEKNIRFQILDNKNITVKNNNKCEKYYEYNVSSESMTKHNKILFENREIIHFHKPELESFYSFSPTISALQEIKKYNHLNNMLLDFAQNGGRTSGVFSYNVPMSKPESLDIEEEIKTAYTKMQTLSTVLVLKGDYKWQQITMTPQEMEITSLLTECAKSICIAYGVPPELAGVDKHTYSNFSELRMFFWNDTIRPICLMIINTINDFFYSKNIKLDLNFSIHDFAEKSGQRESLMKSLESVSFLSRREKRYFFGLDSDL